MSISRAQWEAANRAQAAGTLAIFCNTAEFRKQLCKVNPDVFAKSGVRHAKRAIGTISALSVMPTVAFLAAAGLAVWAFSWWALLVAPITAFILLSYGSYASVGRQSLVGVSVLVFATTFAAFSLVQFELGVRLFTVAVAAAVFLTRYLYVFTSRFVFRACRESFDFFDSFYLVPPNAKVPLLWTDPKIE